jgi:hypothetical protein
MKEQWQELKETIIEMRDNDGTGTQQEVCKFLVNYMGVLEKQMVEQEQTRWIPVSERLPKDIKPVIVTWKNNDPKSYYQYIVGKHFIGTAHFKNGKWFWYSSVTEDLLAEYGKCDSEEFDEAIEVIAWMPLPEPYKAESEDEEDIPMEYFESGGI